MTNADKFEAPRVLLIDSSNILVDALSSEFAKRDEMRFSAVCVPSPSVVSATDLPTGGSDIVILDPTQSTVEPEMSLRVAKQVSGAKQAIAYLPANATKAARQSLDGGYDGVVARNGTIEMLADAIWSLSMGNVYLDGCFGAMSDTADTVPQPSLADLSDREREVLRSVARGRSCKFISQALAISPKTVETHKYRAMSKLGLTSSDAVVEHARRHNWG